MEIKKAIPHFSISLPKTVHLRPKHRDHGRRIFQKTSHLWQGPWLTPAGPNAVILRSCGLLCMFCVEERRGLSRSLPYLSLLFLSSFCYPSVSSIPPTFLWVVISSPCFRPPALKHSRHRASPSFSSFTVRLCDPHLFEPYLPPPSSCDGGGR